MCALSKCNSLVGHECSERLGEQNHSVFESELKEIVSAVQ